MPPRAACTRSPSACRPRSAAGASSPTAPRSERPGQARIYPRGDVLGRRRTHATPERLEDLVGVLVEHRLVVRGTALAQPRECLLEVEVGRARLAREEEAAAAAVPAPQCLRELLDAGIGERARRRPVRERLEQLPELRVGVDSAPAQLDVLERLQLLAALVGGGERAGRRADEGSEEHLDRLGHRGRTVPPRADRQVRMRRACAPTLGGAFSASSSTGCGPRAPPDCAPRAAATAVVRAAPEG